MQVCLPPDRVGTRKLTKKSLKPAGLEFFFNQSVDVKIQTPQKPHFLASLTPFQKFPVLRQVCRLAKIYFHCHPGGGGVQQPGWELLARKKK